MKYIKMILMSSLMLQATVTVHAMNDPLNSRLNKLKESVESARLLDSNDYSDVGWNLFESENTYLKVNYLDLESISNPMSERDINIITCATGVKLRNDSIQKILDKECQMLKEIIIDDANLLKNIESADKWAERFKTFACLGLNLIFGRTIITQPTVIDFSLPAQRALILKCNSNFKAKGSFLIVDETETLTKTLDIIISKRRETSGTNGEVVPGETDEDYSERLQPCLNKAIKDAVESRNNLLPKAIEVLKLQGKQQDLFVAQRSRKIWADRAAVTGVVGVVVGGACLAVKHSDKIMAAASKMMSAKN